MFYDQWEIFRIQQMEVRKRTICLRPYELGGDSLKFLGLKNRPYRYMESVPPSVGSWNGHWDDVLHESVGATRPLEVSSKFDPSWLARDWLHPPAPKKDSSSGRLIPSGYVKIAIENCHL